jgi:putative transposase
VLVQIDAVNGTVGILRVVAFQVDVLQSGSLGHWQCVLGGAQQHRSMYWRTMEIGALPQDEAKYDGCMQQLQAFQYELRPDGRQERQMRRFAGSCRFVFNKALALQKERYEQGEKKLGYAGLCKLLTEWRNSPETSWLADAPVHPLQQTLKDLERAYGNFFAKRAHFPCFKKKGQRDSFRYPDAKQIKLDAGNGRIFLPKLGWLRFRQSRDVLGTVKNVTVSQSCGKWFVSIQTEREVEQPIPKASSVVGIDMGVIRFATFSDGSYLEPLASFRQHEAALRKAQRCMSRKKKFSNNWKKAKARVQKIHSRIGNARRDYLHKATTAISQNHAMVVIEDLQVRNMSKSAKGNADKPGKSVKAKSGLNKSILDQGWFEFRRQLEYKLQWSGGMLVAVPPKNTSRTCPQCGCISKDNRQTQARFACVECGYEENADVVGAINVLRAGHARIACGEDVSRAKPAKARRAASVKQEPAEATQPSQMLV